MSQPNPIDFAGYLLVVAGLTALGLEGWLRWLRRKGLTQGAVGRQRAESASDHQRRNREYDTREIGWLSRHRPIMALAIIIGVAFVVVGIVV